MAGVAAVLSTACTPAGSVEAFCGTLNEGWQTIEASAGQRSPVGAFVAAYEGLGEFEQMLEDLVDVAPEEIADDMERSQEAFSQIVEPVDEASLTAIVGGLSANLDLTLRHRAAFERVDNFSAQECGREVFGLGGLAADLRTLVGGDPADDQMPVEPLDERCQELTDVVETEASRSEHVDALVGTADLEIDGTAAAAAALDGLDASFDDGAAAWTRLRWTQGLDPTTLLKQVNDTAEEICDRPVFSDDVIDRVANMGPQPEGATGPGMMGIYEDASRFQAHDLQGNLLLFHDGSATTSGVVYLLNVDTGDVAELVDATPPGIESPVFTGEGVAWIESDETPAEGLTAASMTWRLLYLDDPAQQPREIRTWGEDDGERFRVVSGWDGHVVINARDRGLIYNVDGDEVAVLDDGVSSDQLGPFHRVGSDLIDVTSGETHPTWGLATTTGQTLDPCFGVRTDLLGTASLTSDGGVDQVERPELRGAWSTQTQGIYDVGDGVVRYGNNLEYFRFSALDEPVWQISRDVVSSNEWRVIAGRLFVYGADGAFVEVDLDTGEPVNGRDELADVAKQTNLFANVLVDWHQGVVLTSSTQPPYFERFELDECAVLAGR